MPLRSGVARSLLRGLPLARAGSMRPVDKAGVQAQLVSKHCTWTMRPMVPAIPSRTFSTSLVRFEPGKKHSDVLREKIPATPETVTSTSTVHPVFGEVGKEETQKEADMMASIRSDLETIKDTFSLKEIPRDAMYLGLAGVLPYLATSLGTVYSAYELKYASENGIGFLLHEQQASDLLHMLEPLQVGYGAVIISFLGAVHWGMEWAQYNGSHPRQRYATGVLAPAIAWPTLLLAPQEALITQFLAFTFLYNSDANASAKGIAPPWYGKYRFVLTMIVGASIVITMIGRSHAGANMDQVPGPIARSKKFIEFGAEGEEKKKLQEEEVIEESSSGDGDKADDGDKA